MQQHHIVLRRRMVNEMNGKEKKIKERCMKLSAIRLKYATQETALKSESNQLACLVNLKMHTNWKLCFNLTQEMKRIPYAHGDFVIPYLTLPLCSL